MQSVTSTPLPPASFIFYSIWVGKMLTTQVMFGKIYSFQLDEVNVVKLHIFIVILVGIHPHDGDADHRAERPFSLAHKVPSILDTR